MPSPTGRDDPSCTHIAGVLLDWFSRHKRDLPWRRTYTPYHVWISEVMLQQTQMERGVEYFKRWIARFPDVHSLAEAPEDEVLKLWEGLGYYSRARNLHKAARQVVNRHKGTLPSSPEDLLALPGIGPYTARAIASIAFGQDVCVVDANVERVISRLYDIALPVKSRQARDEIERHGADLLPEGRARDFNQALMEFGSLVCSPRNPACAECPLADCCLARKSGVQEERPVIVKAPSPIYISMATGVLIHDGRILTQKRRADDVWGNLWEFPGGVVENGETPEQAVVREYLEETGLIVNHPVPIAAFKHSYTRYRVTMHAFSVTLLSSPGELALQAAQEHRWACWSEITKLAFPAGHRQLVHHLRNDPEFRAKVHP
jgi:A/G-specific adenine glycosylase